MLTKLEMAETIQIFNCWSRSICGRCSMRAAHTYRKPSPKNPQRQRTSRRPPRLADSYEIVTLDGLAGDLNDAGHNAANEAGLTIQGLCK